MTDIKTSFGWVELTNFDSNPTDMDTSRGGLAVISNVLNFYNPNTESWIVVDTASTGTFAQLTDTPSTLTGEDNKILKVNNAGDAVEFVTLSGDVTISSVGAATIGSGKVVEGMINDGAVTDTKTTGIVVAENLGEPELADDNYFLTSVAMQATAYTLGNTALPADNPPRNVTITHTAGDTADTLGDAVVTGTNVNDEVITETITVASGTVATGTKAFKTVTEVVTAGWVIDGVEGTADTIKVGFGTLLGLSKVFSSVDNIFIQTLDAAVVAGTVTVDATNVESNTIDISSGTYDGAKTAIVTFFN